MQDNVFSGKRGEEKLTPKIHSPALVARVHGSGSLISENSSYPCGGYDKSCITVLYGTTGILRLYKGIQGRAGLEVSTVRGHVWRLSQAGTACRLEVLLMQFHLLLGAPLRYFMFGRNGFNRGPHIRTTILDGFRGQPGLGSS